ncbi:hypothetical protein EV641_12261 [Rhodococcus sp. SMB37]|uniref:hypothetical protein n=1 Tax=Rhodococcus sp. SMB37 TaxID=2512213 RepID=UPI0010EDBD25|nr:hypothetical protein [Rhodococcus sp. SMB37]TCN45887.1 hypothetical protein EV641_12261 [Rhodococcus sp. SMB37]
MIERLPARAFAAGVVTLALVSGVVSYLMVQPDPAVDTTRVTAAPAEVAASASAPSLVTAAGLEQFRRDYRDRFGDTLLDEATLHDEYASIERAVPHSPDRVMPYSYRGTFESDHSPTTRPVGTPEFDLDALDVPLLARYLAGAPQSVGVPDGSVSHVGLGIDVGEATVSIYVSNRAQENGYLVLTPDGRVLAVRRFEP